MSKRVKLYNGDEKMVYENSIAIDPEKFKKILKQRNLLQTKVSISLGYGRNSLASAINAGVFNGPLVNGLDCQYNIKPNDYELEQETPKTEEHPQDAPKVLTDKALYNTMKNAMTDAMNEAIAKNMPNLRNVVMEAIMKVFK